MNGAHISISTACRAGAAIPCLNPPLSMGWRRFRERLDPPTLSDAINQFGVYTWNGVPWRWKFHFHLRNMNKGGSSRNSWNEKEEVVQACAATILYRKRRNARLLPTNEELSQLLTINQTFRLKKMISDLLPQSKLRGGNGCSTAADADFEEFIYNPLRDPKNLRSRLSRDISGGQEVFPVQVFSDTENCMPPGEFTYISTSDFSTFKDNVVSKAVEELLTIKCDCDNLVCGGMCYCREINDRLTSCTILGDGRVVVNSDATFFNTVVVGCGPKCACKGKCKNSLSAACLPSPFKFEVFRRSDNLGFGLRTLSNIPQGCAVVEFTGEVVEQRVVTVRGQESLDYSFCLHNIEETEIYGKLSLALGVKREVFSSLNEIAYIDPTRKGNIARFISHGCFPNLMMLRYAENDLRLHHTRAILFAAQPIAGGTELFFDYGMNYLSRAGFKCECRTMWCDSVAKRWRSAFPTYEEITKKSLAYFAYMEKRIRCFDVKAKQYLRERGIVRPEYDDLDEPYGTPRSLVPRIDPACVHKRNGEEVPVICYNLYCRSISKCTCKPLVKHVPIITLD